MKVPLSRSVDVNDLKLPCRLTWVGNEWHIFESHVPTTLFSLPMINFDSSWFVNKLNQYIFHHSLISLCLFNDPVLFNSASQSESSDVCEFYVPITEGDFIIVPRLPTFNNENRIRVFLNLNHNSEPQLKLSVDLK